jgi:hypothetical protein
MSQNATLLDTLDFALENLMPNKLLAHLFGAIQLEFRQLRTHPLIQPAVDSLRHQRQHRNGNRNIRTVHAALLTGGRKIAFGVSSAKLGITKAFAFLIVPPKYASGGNSE